VQEILVGAAPKTFFKPPYLGHKGWVGMRLEKKVDWEQVTELLRDGRELSSPKKQRRSDARVATQSRDSAVRRKPGNKRRAKSRS